MQLHRLFNPASMVVIGVSENPQKVGHICAKNIIDQGYQGELYFTHPTLKTLFGKQVYPDITDIPHEIDTAVLAIPSNASVDYLDVLHAKGVRCVVLFAAGFREVAEGKALEQELIRKAKEYGMTILGPNVLGYVNTIKHINATFLKDSVPKGNIGFVTQSGALASVANDMWQNVARLGFSYVVSIGNKTCMNECDVLEYLGSDEHTHVIAMYLEDVSDGERFYTLLSSISRIKPVVIIKSGKTAEGAHAAQSHTGSLAGDDSIFSTAVAQAGGIRAESVQEFFALLELFSRGALPTSRKTLVLSNAGGAGVLLTDALVQHKLPLITIPQDMQNDIVKAIGGNKKISIHNPIDLLGDASAFDYEQAISRVVEDHDIGSVIVLLTPQANTEIEKTARILARVQHTSAIPIYPVFMGEYSVREAHDYFAQHNMMSANSFDMFPAIIEKSMQYREWCRYKLTSDEPPAREAGILSKLSLRSRTGDERQSILDKEPMGLPTVFSLFEQISIPLAEYSVVDSVESADQFAKKAGYPVVLKSASSAILHKTEKKAVRVGISNVQELKESFSAMKLLAQKNEPVAVVQRTVKGIEFIAGAKRDPVFGPVVLLGLGGIYTELLQQISLRVMPLGIIDVSDMLAELRLEKLVTGFRNMPPLDVKVLHTVLSGLGGILETYATIAEVEINPLIVENGMPVAVDGRVVYERER